VPRLRDMSPRPCVNCGRPAAPGQRRRGRCLACAHYFYDHGRERPPEWERPRLPARRVCRDCQRPCRAALVVDGRCRVCAEYARRHGVARPPVGPRRTGAPCVVCGEPIAHDRGRRGRCPACYMYWYRHRTDRSVPRTGGVASEH
jgi:hypothetical protein